MSPVLTDSVYDVVVHHPDEPVLVFLVFLVVVAYEYPAFSRSSHDLAPNFSVWDGDSGCPWRNPPGAIVSDRDHT